MCKLQFRLPSGIFFGGWVAPGSSEKIRGHIYLLLLLPLGQAFQKKKAFVAGGAEICRCPSMHLLTLPSPNLNPKITLAAVLKFCSSQIWALSPVAYFMQPITETRMQISIVIGEEAEMEKTNWVILEFAAVKSISKLQPCRPERLPWTQWRYNHGVAKE